MEGIQKQWWCHACAKQYTATTPSYACTECGGEFVEELNQPDPNGGVSIGVSQTTTQPVTNHQPNNNTSSPYGGIPGTHYPWGGGNLSTFSTVMSNQHPVGSIIQQILNPLLSQSNVINMTVTGSPVMMYPGGGGFNPFSILQSLNIPMGQSIFNGNTGDYVENFQLEEVINRLFQQYEKKGNPPASADVINNLKTTPLPKELLEKQDQPSCVTCTVDYSEGEEVIILPCSHIFHSDCIKTWLKIHNTCPICRYEFPTDDKDYEKLREARANRNGPNSHPPGSSSM